MEITSSKWRWTQIWRSKHIFEWLIAKKKKNFSYSKINISSLWNLILGRWIRISAICEKLQKHFAGRSSEFIFIDGSSDDLRNDDALKKSMKWLLIRYNNRRINTDNGHESQDILISINEKE